MNDRPRTLRSDLTRQLAFVRTRSPAHGRLLELLIDELDRGLEARLAEVWSRRTFGAFFERPLLLLAGLRDDTLREGKGHPLWAGIATDSPDPGALDQTAVEAALAADRAHLWRTLAERHIQTNETSRAIAWLWPARLASVSIGPRPIELYDIGASAGLNLIADHLPPIWTGSNGSAVEIGPLPPIVRRLGFDLRPLDVRREEDARWLRACVWPGQDDREARLEQAIEVYLRLQSDPHPPSMKTAAAGEVPSLLPLGGDEERLALAYQMVMRDYLSNRERNRYVAGMREWLESRRAGTAMWVELEVTGATSEGHPPATIRAHVRDGDGVRSMVLAACDPHPRHLVVNHEAVTEFAGVLRGKGFR